MEIGLLDELRSTIRAHGFSRKTEAAYVRWVRRYALFHGKRHPAHLDGQAVAAFLSHLASEYDGGAAKRAQAASALHFLYRHVLGRAVRMPRAAGRLRQPTPPPIVLTRAEVKRILHELSGAHRIVVSLLYGSGLRLLEALQLRFRDVDLERNEITVRSGGRGHRRMVPVPATVAGDLKLQLAQVRELHSRDRTRRAGWVTLHGIPAQRYPRGLRQLTWQYVFPAARCHTDALSGRRCRHHLHETAVQRAIVRAARRAGIGKHVTCHTFRRSYAAHMLDSGYDIRTIQELMGHRSVRSTRLYYRLIDPESRTVRSPLDLL